MSLFINRIEELAFLESEYAKDSSSLVIIYGRRRVGKTELSLKFGAGKASVYYLARKLNLEQQVDDFLEKTSEQLDIYQPKIPKWDGALKFIADQMKENGKPLIIIDEVPYLIEGSNTVMSAFQAAWDLHLKDANVMVILLGSSIGMMENEVLGYKSPLYGRRSGQIKVEPLKYKHTAHFFPQKNPEEIVQTYGCLGGMPAYLNKFDKSLSFIDNVNRNIMHRATFLYDEATFLLKEELREPAKYELILEAISKGKNRVSEISNETGIPVNNIPKYLRVLIGLGFVTREWPIVLKKARDIKIGSIYIISDNFIKFWYTYVYPTRSMLEINRDGAVSKISNTYNRYLGYIFEDIVKQYLIDLNVSSKLPIVFEKIGRQWGNIQGKQKGKNSYEIDLVALNESSKEILFVECKWQVLTENNAKNILNDLKEKSRFVYWNNEERKDYFAVVAKEIENKVELRTNGIMVFDLDDLFE